MSAVRSVVVDSVHVPAQPRRAFSKVSLEWHRAIAATADVELLEIREASAEDDLPLIRWRQGGHDFKAAPRFERGVERMRIWRMADNRLGDITFGRATPPAVVWKELTRTARILVFGGLLIAVAACATGADTSPRPDALDSDASTDAVVDASPDTAPGATDAAPDAPAGVLGLEADCDPTHDECAPGLTCRPTGNLRGACRPIGPLPAGAACQAESDCGYAMTWFSDSFGVARCAVVCDTAAPQSRCKPNQPCLSLVGRLGICEL